MVNPQEKVETWHNTSLGLKWYRCFDTLGRETSKVVRGGHTFTLTTLERQINQEEAIPDQDLFRNGTFVLKKSSEETQVDEIVSPNSLTDSQIDAIEREVTYGEEKLDDYLQTIDSLVTLRRLLEAFVIDDASKASDVEAIKARMAELNPDAPNENRMVSTTPKPDPKPIKLSAGGYKTPAATKV